MSLGSNTYGRVAGVEALCPMYTDGGAFDMGTRPTLVEVEGFLDRVSGV